MCDESIAIEKFLFPFSLSLKMVLYDDQHRYHRQPTGFGIAVTPRQDVHGQRFDWSQSRANCMSVVIEVSRSSAQAILPPGFEIDPECAQPTILFEPMHLRNLPWLAGRGYNTFAVFVNNVVYESQGQKIIGSFMAVLFESLCEPICTGREELGFPKIFADQPDVVLEGDTATYSVTSFGTEVLRLSVGGLVNKSLESAPVANKGSKPYTHPLPDGILAHRYMPTVGSPGYADASYASHLPGSSKRIIPFNYREGDPSQTKLEIFAKTWEEIPTLYPIIQGLSKLELGKILEVSEWTDLAGDLKSIKALK